ncbi:hypothetical protein [Streptomyces sp. NPDC059916]|uniref:hypothetical protein n=1 Tax=Streptomyces sp. NPDC059916 TaxID=3347001 RepID=UPI00368B0095
MDIYTKEIVFAAAGVLLIASPAIWHACDCLLGRRRRRAEEAAAFRALLDRESAALDAIVLERSRNEWLRAQVQDPAAVVNQLVVLAAAKQVIDEAYPRVRDLYDAPTLSRQ